MATVTVNVKANTGEATQDINQLDTALEGADAAAEQLNDSLEKQENRIKTLGGAINIVGGSVEVLAGSLAVSGALTEEQAQQFEAAAVGAIAFADGSKRIFEGVKELNEGLRASGGIVGIATKAFNRLKLAILANPYTALAIAIGTVTAGIIAFTGASRASRDTTKQYNEQLQKQLDLLDGINRQYFSGEEQLAILEASAKARNVTIQEQIEFEKERATEAKNRAQAEINAANAAVASGRIEQETADNIIALQEKKRLEAEKYYNQIIAAETVRQQQIKEGQQLIEDYEKTVSDLQPELQKINEEIVKTLFDFTTQAIKELPDLIIEEIELDEVEEAGEEVGDTFVTGFDLSFRQGLKETNAKLKKFFASETATAIGSNLQAASELTSALVEVVDDGSEEAFERAKKYKIAEVITSSTQAAFQAFAAAQQFGPVLGPIIGAAQVAAIGVAASRAIGDIRNSTFDGSGGGVPGGVNAPQAFTTGTQTIDGATGTVAPTVGDNSGLVRAYVLSSEVANELEANTLLNNRRQFP